MEGDGRYLGGPSVPKLFYICRTTQQSFSSFVAGTRIVLLYNFDVMTVVLLNLLGQLKKQETGNENGNTKREHESAQKAA